MKRLVALFFIYFSLYADVGDPYKGQTYFAHLLYPKLGHNGAVFTKKHTKDEWKELFGDNAKRFFAEFGDFGGELTSDVLLHLEAFAVKYAKDSDATPVCDN